LQFGRDPRNDYLQASPYQDRGSDSFSLAPNWFGCAQRICFFGFGFDPLNIDRLNLASVLQLSREQGRALPWIFASALHKTDGEVNAARERLIAGNSNWTAESQNSSTTLRRTDMLTLD
jgi:hypothetical protein